jgi:hypothetical protein
MIAEPLDEGLAQDIESGAVSINWVSLALIMNSALCNYSSKVLSGMIMHSYCNPLDHTILSSTAVFSIMVLLH